MAGSGGPEGGGVGSMVRRVRGRAGSEREAVQGVCAAEEGMAGLGGPEGEGSSRGRRGVLRTGCVGGKRHGRVTCARR